MLPPVTAPLRLRQLFVRVCQTPAASQKRSRWEAWAEALTGGDASSPRLSEGISLAMSLIVRIKNMLAEAGIPADAKQFYVVYLQDYERHASLRHIGESWGLTIPHLQPLDPLHAQFLTLGELESEVTDDLTALKQEIDSLATSVKASSIPRYMRDFILEVLGDLRFCLDHADLFGQAGLERAFARTFAEMATVNVPNADMTADVGGVMGAIHSLYRRFSFGAKLIGEIEAYTSAIAKLPPPGQ